MVFIEQAESVSRDSIFSSNKTLFFSYCTVDIWTVFYTVSLLEVSLLSMMECLAANPPHKVPVVSRSFVTSHEVNHQTLPGVHWGDKNCMILNYLVESSFAGWLNHGSS